jgi:hypothetical protein
VGIVQQLLLFGADPNKAGVEKQTPLHIAAQAGTRAGSVVFLRFFSGYFFLFFVFYVFIYGCFFFLCPVLNWLGHFMVCSVLLNCGADYNAQGIILKTSDFENFF